MNGRTATPRVDWPVGGFAGHLCTDFGPLSLSQFAPLDRDAAATATSDALTWQRITTPADPAFADAVAFAHRQQRYWFDTRPGPTTAHDVAQVLRVLPAGAARDQKMLWALRRGGRVVGCLDVMRQWPQPGTVSIGLLLIDERLRRQGLGQAVLEQLAARCRAWPGVRRWRAAVVEHQAGALAFWRRAGFLDTGLRHVAPELSAPLIVLERYVAR